MKTLLTIGAVAGAAAAPAAARPAQWGGGRMGTNLEATPGANAALSSALEPRPGGSHSGRSARNVPQSSSRADQAFAGAVTAGPCPGGSHRHGSVTAVATLELGVAPDALVEAPRQRVERPEELLLHAGRA